MVEGWKKRETKGGPSYSSMLLYWRRGKKLQAVKKQPHDYNIETAYFALGDNLFQKPDGKNSSSLFKRIDDGMGLQYFWFFLSAYAQKVNAVHVSPWR